MLLLVFLAAQVPFLQADPHRDVAPTSRDAFTDEGLNTSQVINRVNHGRWGVNECDNLIKTPLFSLWLFPGYGMFGTSNYVGHLWVLLGVVALLWFFSRRHPVLPWVAGVFVLLGLTQYHLFQYSRFTMAEVTASALVLAGLGCALRFGQSRRPAHWVWAGVFLWAAVFTKNQFGYVLLLLPAWGLAVQWVYGKLWSRHTRVVLAHSVFILVGGALLYYCVWYLPVKPTYDYVMGNQASGRLVPLSQFSEMVLQAKTFFVASYTRAYACYTVLAAGLLLFNFWLSKDKTYRLLSLLALLWAVFELHKFAMWFVPSRYLVPLLFAWGVFFSVQLVWAVQNALHRGPLARLLAGLALAGALALFVVNGYHGGRLYREREFVMHETNLLLSRIDFGGRPAMGPWAPALARETGARVLPVWHNYFNDKDVLQKYNPKVIVSEWDEGDSDGAYRKQGINLAQLADSTREVRVARFRLVIYYLP